jgi:hypothetical protein
LGFRKQKTTKTYKILHLKKILIISPHYPPSNLAAVHRTRLFAQHLPSFGWEPIILSVDERDYEENLDWNLHALLPYGQRIEKVRAFPVSKPRLIGDIGLRAFFQLRSKALNIVQKENIKFVYIPIPSFYTSLIGTYLNRKTGVKFGIDYIDPWVHSFPGSEKVFSRHWFSTKLAKFLEPKALKNVSLITGVAQGYYNGVIERNPKLVHSCIFGAMPYGGEKMDHESVKNMVSMPYLFNKKNKIQLIYAGAMLPKAYTILELFFQVMSENSSVFENIEIHFIGSGKTPNDAKGFNVKPYAEKFGLWEKQIFEYPKRIPYLDVLIHLENVDGVFILGSTEPHYTPSKTYQAVLSEKPIFALLHEASTAAQILEKTKAGKVVKIIPESLKSQKSDLLSGFIEFLSFLNNFDPKNVDLEEFTTYSAKNVTEALVQLLDKTQA